MADDSVGRAGCYLCSDDPKFAQEDACEACDRAFWNDPIGIVLDEEVSR